MKVQLSPPRDRGDVERELLQAGESIGSLCGALRDGTDRSLLGNLPGELWAAGFKFKRLAAELERAWRVEMRPQEPR